MMSVGGLHLPGHSPRDWSEDFQHENGNYVCKCFDCRNYFFGHKRRSQCRVCANKTKEGDE